MKIANFIFLFIFPFLTLNSAIAAEDKLALEMKAVAQATATGKSCKKHLLNKSELQNFLDAWKSSTYRGADKFKWDFSIKLDFKSGETHEFLIEKDRIQISGNWNTWTLKDHQKLFTYCK